MSNSENIHDSGWVHIKWNNRSAELCTFARSASGTRRSGERVAAFMYDTGELELVHCWGVEWAGTYECYHHLVLNLSVGSFLPDSDLDEATEYDHLARMYARRWLLEDRPAKRSLRAARQRRRIRQQAEFEGESRKPRVAPAGEWFSTLQAFEEHFDKAVRLADLDDSTYRDRLV